MHEIEMYVSNRITDRSLEARVSHILVKHGIRTKKDLLNKFKDLTKADIIYTCKTQFHACGEKCAKEIGNIVEIARNENSPEDRKISAELLSQIELAKENLTTFQNMFDLAVSHYKNEKSQTAAYKVLQAAQSLYISYDRYTTLESLI